MAGLCIQTDLVPGQVGLLEGEGGTRVGVGMLLVMQAEP